MTRKDENREKLGVSMVEERQINGLRRLGLTEYEARIYLVLVTRGPIKASELSFLGQIPRTKTYGAINELERKGLLRIMPSKPEVYSPGSPSEILVPMVNKLSRELGDTDAIVQGLVLTFESNKFVKRDVPKEVGEIWEIQGRKGIANKMNQVFSDAKISINFCTSAAGLIRAYKSHCDMLEKARDHGAEVRIMAPVNSENAGLAREIGEVLKFKALDKPFAQNFVAIDSRELIAIEAHPEDLRTDQGADKGIWTTNRFLVELHDQLFERLWNVTLARKVAPHTV